MVEALLGNWVGWKGTGKLYDWGFTLEHRSGVYSGIDVELGGKFVLQLLLEFVERFERFFGSEDGVGSELTSEFLVVLLADAHDHLERALDFVVVQLLREGI